MTPAESPRDYSSPSLPSSSLGMYNYKVLLAYDGTAYAGFQLQPAAPTVQGRLEGALVKFTRQPREALVVQGAARTDAGVHARGQVAQFYSRRSMEATTVRRALNSLLPDDIRVLAAERVPIDYNVRFTVAKTYWYDIHLDPIADPFACRYRSCAPRGSAGGVDLAALQQAARCFVGTHNFSAFCSASEDTRRRSAVRTVTRFEVLPLPGGVRLAVSGEGFLYKQVRHMVGAVVSAGVGRLAPEDIAAALEGGQEKGAAVERLRRGKRMYMVAEAKGLCLAHVELPAAADPDGRQYPGGAPLMRRAELLAARAAGGGPP